MANRPQTLYGIAASPVGMAAWKLDHDASSLALITRVFDPIPVAVSAFTDELYQAPRRWAQRAYPELIH
jgi:hypothetical protein